MKGNKCERVATGKGSESAYLKKTKKNQSVVKSNWSIRAGTEGRTGIFHIKIAASAEIKKNKDWLRPWRLRGRSQFSPPGLKPTASCLYPTTPLPLVWPVQQKSCIETHRLDFLTSGGSCLVPEIRNMGTGNDGTDSIDKQSVHAIEFSAHSILPLPHTALIR